VILYQRLSFKATRGKTTTVRVARVSAFIAGAVRVPAGDFSHFLDLRQLLRVTHA
jgi:hypothetical protein